MTAIPLVLDGYLDELPVPGDDGLTARFRVIPSPTDDTTDETVFACRTADPHLAHALLNLVQPGDLLRIGGHLALPGPADEGGPRMDVDALELLAPAPARHLAEMVLDRYGSYLVVFDPDVDTVPVFTETGTWVGTAEHTDAITDLIHAHESGNPPPSS
ncbi:hypothetical protein EDD98_7687 [Streptomyces sp. PanSC19]|uniref:hypothetical protein n=1 Tax=Streptomyces sp. PanSC19 TaxID=1520455 RepID=UPI000F470702|nr:hypothetical protein [Streptomyces sp. PanSC19]ROQ23237.1 hypothetical protein EDD98_7687 [Streptomyces sp. PanSC19]